MSGAVMIVAMRLRDDGMVRVAMMPGTAHANELSIATNARPSSPVAAMIRSMRNAARDKYPTFSSSDRTRNSSMICGTKTSVAPTPPMMPLPTSEASVSFGMCCAWAPSHANPCSTRSCSGAATVKMAWKNRNIVAKNTARPATGCSSTASMRRERVSCPAGMYSAAASTERDHGASCASCVGGLTTGRVQAGTSASRVRMSSTPTPVAAMTARTGTPRARSRAATSRWPPRACSSSIIVRASIVGLPNAIARATKGSERRNVVASATTMSASGAGTPSSRPARASTTTCSSGLTASRL